MKYTPYPYQQHSIDHILDNPEACLFLDMGLGKTAVTLTAIDTLINDQFKVSKVLIIAPKRVAEVTWTDEALKWDHLKGLKFSKVLGLEKKRKQALNAEADIYLINRENVPWLVGQYQSAWPFDMLVIDELSSFKDSKSIRFKALRQMLPYVTRRLGLTGTPMPNGLLDLWPQMYLIDNGKRLGEKLSEYRTKYFNRIDVYHGQQRVDDYELKTPDADEEDVIGVDCVKQEVFDKLNDICISMKASDYLSIPERLDNLTKVNFTGAIMQQYKDFEKEKVLEFIESGKEITAATAAALSGKLQQFANGAVYDENKEYHEVHNLKIDALGETLEALQGKPLLVTYSFKSDVERIRKHLKSFKPEEFKADTVTRWNRGEIRFLLGHPASMGHGLNMQDGGNYITHFGLVWSLELYLQVIARLDRQGQKYAVINERIISPGTVDERIIAVQEGREADQNSLMNSVKAIINQYKKAF